jgi:phosphoglycolate phosphatase
VLANSLDPVVRCVNRALVELGHGERTAAEIRPIIGPPTEIGFGGLLGLPPESKAVARAVKAYRALYVDGLWDTPPYPGIVDVVFTLAETRRLAVATSKPLVYANPVVEALGLTDAFDVVVGPERGGDQSKAKQIAGALDALGEPASAMVGDRSYDIEAAKEFGLLAVGALWGFGSREELEAAGADVLVAEPAELLQILT